MGWDDWLMVLSLVLYTIFISFVLAGLHYGTGRHMTDVKENDFLSALRYGYFSEWSYVLVITTIKISIALFYLRIIIPPWQRIVVKCTMWIVIFFGLAYFWLMVIQCWPIPFIWQRYSRVPSGVLTFQNGGCLPKGVVVGATYAHSIINAGTDWALALLPIVMLWNVQMPIGVKFIVGGIVACGILLTVRKQPELKIPANIAGKRTSSGDVEMGDTVKAEDGKKFEPEVEDSSRTIEIHWDERNGDGNLEWVDTPTTLIQRSSGSSSGLDSRGLKDEIGNPRHISLQSSTLLPPATSYKRDSGSTLASDGLEEYIEDYPRTQLRPSPYIQTLTYTPSNLSPTILSPSTFTPSSLLPTIPPPTSPSPSHLAFCMRDSQYSRNSKIEPSSPV
ncbi:hypothetical protein DID88_009035 [Monilinia fructigena]|uniref:Rhodopsin domain-containing protein n=1 Tax=Monilinia fructigena TaxID=38457 RepID=A0A395IFN9_9HELO|nr:hypothetical protein DID88_009035 [Monilinia fructigena]